MEGISVPKDVWNKHCWSQQMNRIQLNSELSSQTGIPVHFNSCAVDRPLFSSAKSCDRQTDRQTYTYHTQTNSTAVSRSTCDRKKTVGKAKLFSRWRHLQLLQQAMMLWRYDTINWFYVHLKAVTSNLNLPHGIKN